jgi:myo-inositol-1(or 4)-monophosphatase
MRVFSTMTNMDSRFLAGCAAVRAAGRLARRHFENRGALTIESKGAQDHVSEADRAVERLIVAQLGAAFPEDGFLGEEGGGAAHDQLWIIDPIDGTTNFVHGLAAWCVSLAYMRAGVLEIGLIYDPMADALYAAQRGNGATLNGAPMRVSSCAAIDQAMVGIGFSYRRPVEPFAAAAQRLLAAHCEFRRFGSGALGMAHVASGRLEGYWEQHINSWDVAAGILLVREAGGWTNDFFAGKGLLEGNPILACAPALRAPLATLTGMG